MIEFRNVTVCYDPQARYPVNAVDNVNLTIKSGEWVFLVGPSGAGKSTLLKLLHCGVQTTSGQIFFEGQGITRLAAREIPWLRRRIGVVFQDFQLLAQKTAWENVAFALRVIGAPQRRLAREVPRALDTVGLTHKAHAHPHELSGGEQQRIAIARAIVNDPVLLLADEPTGNLDPKTAWDVTQVLRRINEERGTTVLMATHDRTIVDAFKRRVVRLIEGRIVSDEAEGIYHPEDNEQPAVSSAPVTTGNINGNIREGEDVAFEEVVPAEVMFDGSVLDAVEADTAPSVSAAPSPLDEVSTPEVSTPEVSTPSTPIAAPEVVPRAKTRARRTKKAIRQEAMREEAAPNGVGSDAFPTDALNNDAPLGSDQNPIVQYRRTERIKRTKKN